MSAIPEQYHCWYYNEAVWTRTSFLGVPCQKSVSDMWNYQEILSEIKPSLVIEFGTKAGGSALFFSAMLRMISQRGRVLTVDIDHSQVFGVVRQNSWIEMLESSSTAPGVGDRIRELRAEYPGKVFFILDSDHTKDHVMGELMLLRPLTQTGDHVIVEDSNINGHPVLPGWGPGPYEALMEYRALYPQDYRHDREREEKFGFTFAPAGFLIRN